MKYLCSFICFLVFLAVTQAEETLAQRLIAQYRAIESVSCEVTKVVESGERKIRSLSRVYYSYPDRIHIDNVRPLKRRYVADGEWLYYYIEGDPKGFSRRVEELDSDWLISLRKVPGTPMDHLLKIASAEETVLPPTDAYPTRRGYAAETFYAVICVTAEGIPSRIEYYRTPDMKEQTGEYTYEHFEQVLPDVWVPMMHKGTVRMVGLEQEETSRFTNYTVNEPVADRLFEPGPFFEGVKFTDSFKDIYGD